MKGYVHVGGVGVTPERVQVSAGMCASPSTSAGWVLANKARCARARAVTGWGAGAPSGAYLVSRGGGSSAQRGSGDSCRARPEQ